jgi:hypothetical protein
MVSIDELHQENHKLTELANVLLYLFRDRAMCDTETGCELFYTYLDKVHAHLSKVDHLYGTLLRSKDEQASETARNFMSGEQEIKRIIATYTRKWCDRKHRGLRVANHDAFLRYTEELFETILRRIQGETEKLYPLVRRLDEAA